MFGVYSLDYIVVSNPYLLFQQLLLLLLLKLLLLKEVRLLLCLLLRPLLLLIHIALLLLLLLLQRTKPDDISLSLETLPKDECKKKMLQKKNGKKKNPDETKQIK